MSRRRQLLISFLVLATLGVLALAIPLAPQVRSTAPVTVATLQRMQNLDLEASRSNRPAFLPREWGRLVSVQRITDQHYMLFLQSDGGDIYLVRLVQRGQYLYLDTYDKGGVALALSRQP